MDKLEKINLLCSDIEKEINIHPECISAMLINTVVELHEYIEEEPEQIKESVVDRLQPIVLKSEQLVKVWLYSVLITFSRQSKIMEEFIEYLIIEDKFGPNIKYFLYYQILLASFQNVCFENENTKYLRWKLVEKITDEFREETKDLLSYIPEEQRNQNKVFVVCEQILSKNHAPTKIALEQCKFLIGNENKNVLLINTAESITQVGKVPYYMSRHSNYVESYLSNQFMEWRGTKIPFFQCENNMPNITDIREILRIVRNVKPGLVLSIGGSSMLANLINDIIPVLTYGMTADMKETMTSCQTLCRNFNQEDIHLLNRMGIKENSIILIQPKVSLRPQWSVISRKELGLPESKFIVAVVGNRLDSDIDETFLNMLSCTLDEDMAVAIIGNFLSFEKYMLKMPELRGKIYYLGYSEDILAWIEVCDLYINPRRIGGGTSAVDALIKGLPVITISYGDVAVCVGEEFCTESYDTMSDLIKQYKEDKVFYKKMSALAKEKAAVLIDTPENFHEIIKEFQKRTRDLHV